MASAINMRETDMSNPYDADSGWPGPGGRVPPPAAVHQPAPVKNTEPCIQDQVIADIEARKQVGFQRYGTLLQPFNGRDALMDAYQEALDLAQYLKQALVERDRAKTITRLPPGFNDGGDPGRY